MVTVSNCYVLDKVQCTCYLQVVDFVDAFEALHPDWQLLLEIDWSSGHAKHRIGALNVNGMNVGYGGGQTTPRDVKIPEEVPSSKSQ